MYQGARPAAKDAEAFVAIVAQLDSNCMNIARKFDSIKFNRCIIQADEVPKEELNYLAPDAAVIYINKNNSFLFKAIVAIKSNNTIPTIVASEHYDEFTAVLALQLGADEYLSSQVGAQDLRLRVLRLLRKSESFNPDQTTAAFLKTTIDDSDMSNIRRSVFPRDRATFYSFLTPYEFEVLLLLISSPGKALSRDTISLAVRGRNTKHADRSVDNLVARVRKKLSQLGFSKYLIRGFHSVGYLFVGDGEQFLDDLENAIKKQEERPNTNRRGA